MKSDEKIQNHEEDLLTIIELFTKHNLAFQVSNIWCASNMHLLLAMNLVISNNKLSSNLKRRKKKLPLPGASNPMKTANSVKVKLEFNTKT